MKKLLLALSGSLLLSACVTTAIQDSSLVYISTGAVQCESEGKTGVETASMLTEEGIAVTTTLCGSLTDTAVATMCGGPTTSINVHSIATADLEKAQALGFESVTVLKAIDSLGYDASLCK